MNMDMRVTRFGCVAVATLVVLAVLVVVWGSCTVLVPADRIGVRTILSSGIEPKDYDAGYVWAIPGLHSVRLWDPTWTNLKETLQVRGSDQYTTTVDISVLLRLVPGQCHEVAKIYTDEKHVEQMVSTMLNKYANEILAQMKTEDFYNTKVRDQKALEAQQAIDKDLRPIGIEVKNVLLRNIVYDPKFEQQLLQKQLSGQTKSLEISKGKLAAAQTETELITRKAEAEVKRIEESKRQEIENLTVDLDRKIAALAQDAKLASTMITAKAESTKRQKVAQADLLKAQAEATGTAALSKAYARPGARYYFAKKAVESMSIGELELNSNTFNPLEIDRMLKALGLSIPDAPTPPSAPGSAAKKP